MSRYSYTDLSVCPSCDSRIGANLNFFNVLEPVKLMLLSSEGLSRVYCFWGNPTKIVVGLYFGDLVCLPCAQIAGNCSGQAAYHHSRLFCLSWTTDCASWITIA